MGEAEFGKGMVVEVCSDDQGLRGAWFVGTVLRSLPRKKRVLVEYHTLMAEESTKPLKELVDVVNIRPIAPRETDRSFNTSDEVDAAHNDGWWEGVVIRVLDNHRYLVYFRTGKEEHVFQRSELRIHREWVHGKWVPPVVEEKSVEEKVRVQLQNTEKQASTHPGSHKFHKTPAVSANDLIAQPPRNTATHGLNYVCLEKLKSTVSVSISMGLYRKVQHSGFSSCS